MSSIIIGDTGGTIVSTANARHDLVNYSVKTTIAEMLATMPEVDTLGKVSAKRILGKDSCKITSADLLSIYKHVAEWAADPEIDGIVLTHGTDTLEETAYFLHVTVQTAKPIIVVGAMRPSSAFSADGPLNLFHAILVATSQEARDKGVLVVSNSRIFGARDVTKTHTTAVDTFRSREYGALGEIAGGQLFFYNGSSRVHTIHSSLDISRVTKLPTVDLVYDYQGAGSHLVKAAVDSGAQGIVIAGMGNGGVSDGALQGEDYALESGVVCVRSSRVGNGVVTVKLMPERRVVTANSLLPQKARVLLMVCIALGLSFEEMGDVFDRY